MEDPCSLPSPGSSPHWQVLKIQKIWKLSAAAAVIRRGSLSLLYCPSRLAGSRCLAGFHAVLGVPASCSVSALTSRDGHVQTEESQLSLHNHCSSDLSHFCPHKRILSTYFLLTSSIFSRLSLSPSSLAVMRVQAYRGAAVLFSHR